jgi:hypothetical protein
MDPLFDDEPEEQLLPPPTERAAACVAMRQVMAPLNDRLLRTPGIVHPRTAARMMGIPVVDGAIGVDGMWELTVVAEYSIYYHVTKGKRLFERVLDQGTGFTDEERAALELQRRSFASVFEVAALRPELWEVDLIDRLENRGLTTIIDRNWSATASPGLLLFARILRGGSFCCTSGVALPLLRRDAGEDAREFVLRRCRGVVRSPGTRTLQHALFYACRQLHLRSGIGVEFR